MEFYEYSATQPDARQNVELLVRNTDQWSLPCESWLEVAGKLIKVDGTSYATTAEVALENTLIGLWDSLRLVANGQEVESLQQEADVAAQILGLVRYSDDFAKTGASGRFWFKDTSTAADTQRYQLQSEGGNVTGRGQPQLQCRLCCPARHRYDERLRC